ncbi:MAG: hypothetical protein KatS3mg104_2990 [Phycisphaerae bacterium]|nr:MAG: hypothetical protein KatS3mg104_2990 [Phycisphaerae bacterium]
MRKRFNRVDNRSTSDLLRELSAMEVLPPETEEDVERYWDNRARIVSELTKRGIHYGIFNGRIASAYTIWKSGRKEEFISKRHGEGIY